MLDTDGLLLTSLLTPPHCTATWGNQQNRKNLTSEKVPRFYRLQVENGRFRQLARIVEKTTTLLENPKLCPKIKRIQCNIRIIIIYTKFQIHKFDNFSENWIFGGNFGLSVRLQNAKISARLTQWEKMIKKFSFSNFSSFLISHQNLNFGAKVEFFLKWVFLRNF